MQIAIRGAVQGVGFRPFVYRLARELDLAGWVNNSSRGVFIEAEGDQSRLEAFLLRLEREKPPRSFIQSLESSFLDPAGYLGFEIRESDSAGEKSALVMPDISMCQYCLDDIRDPLNRRFRYPFTNCTNCGPRFTIIEALPYDRFNTTMRSFMMCNECRAEYEDPLDRRFHAQPNACPACGPHLELWTSDGSRLASADDALLAAVSAIAGGSVVAVKGLGGFHLIVDASSDEAVSRLRQRKHREEKPFAVMYPSIDAIRGDCEVSPIEERLLLSPESPIVLIRRCNSAMRDRASISSFIAPRNPSIGAMLPYTPLHHLLLSELQSPVVATSGNRSDEPICTDEREALERLRGIADVFLVHDRRIARHVDDSIARVMMGREMVMRRARGYAPLPVNLAESATAVLATGGHLKNTVAVALGKDVFLSQHIGDLETAQAFDAFKRVIKSFNQLYEATPVAAACDQHPGYLSTQFAKSAGLPLVHVQHHYAHVLSCVAENRLQEPVLGVSWDGTGYGTDETIWGGEFIRVPGSSPDPEDDPAPFHRVAHLRTFRLPGGEKAVKEPRRVAIGMLYQIFGEAAFDMSELAPIAAFSLGERTALKSMLKANVNSPITSSAGRLFDAVASLADLRQETRFEGQAAMELEFALDGVNTDESYQFGISPCRFERGRDSRSAIVVDWAPIIRGVIDDLALKAPVGYISAKFHNALVEAIIAVASRIGEERIVITGGCFQNKYLTERCITRLEQEGFRAYWHQRVPPNDGGISLGQAAAAIRWMNAKSSIDKSA